MFVAQLYNPFEHERRRTKEEKLNGRDEDKRGAEKRRRMDDRETGETRKNGEKEEKERSNRGTRTKITDDPAVCLLLNSC